MDVCRPVGSGARPSKVCGHVAEVYVWVESCETMGRLWAAAIGGRETNRREI